MLASSRQLVNTNHICTITGERTVRQFGISLGIHAVLAVFLRGVSTYCQNSCELICDVSGSDAAASFIRYGHVPGWPYFH